MDDRLKKACAALFCHRAIHGALACAYGAGCAGVSKELIGYAVTLCYLVLFVRG